MQPSKYRRAAAADRRQGRARPGQRGSLLKESELVTPLVLFDQYTSQAYILPVFTFIELSSFEAVRSNYLDDDEFARLRWRLASGQIVLVTMYGKNVRENVDPALLLRLKKGFEHG